MNSLAIIDAVSCRVTANLHFSRTCRVQELPCLEYMLPAVQPFKLDIFTEQKLGELSRGLDSKALEAALAAMDALPSTLETEALVKEVFEILQDMKKNQESSSYTEKSEDKWASWMANVRGLFRARKKIAPSNSSLFPEKIVPRTGPPSSYKVDSRCCDVCLEEASTYCNHVIREEQL
jgi:hypothetical protein